MDNNKTGSEKGNVTVSDCNQKEVDRQRENLTMNINSQLVRSTPFRKKPKWFRLNATPKILTTDRPSLRQSLEGDDKKAWVQEINTEVTTHRKLDCWVIFDRSREERVVYTKFVLKKIRSEIEAVCRQRAHLVVCGIVEVECCEDTFLPVSHYSVIKLINSHNSTRMDGQTHRLQECLRKLEVGEAGLRRNTCWYVMKRRTERERV